MANRPADESQCLSAEKTRLWRGRLTECLTWDQEEQVKPHDSRGVHQELLDSVKGHTLMPPQMVISFGTTASVVSVFSSGTSSHLLRLFFGLGGSSLTSMGAPHLFRLPLLV